MNKYENFRFNDGRFNKNGYNEIYIDDESVVNFNVDKIGDVKINDKIYKDALVLSGGYLVVKPGYGYGRDGIGFIFHKLPKIKNIIIKCYPSACGFWKKIGGKPIDSNKNDKGELFTYVINRNNFI